MVILDKLAYWLDDLVARGEMTEAEAREEYLAAEEDVRQEFENELREAWCE